MELNHCFHYKGLFVFKLTVQNSEQAIYPDIISAHPVFPLLWLSHTEMVKPLRL